MPAAADERVMVTLFKSADSEAGGWLPISNSVLHDLRVRKVRDFTSYLIGEVKEKDLAAFEQLAMSLGVRYSNEPTFFEMSLPALTFDPANGLPPSIPTHLLFSKERPADVWLIQYLGPPPQESVDAMPAAGLAVLSQANSNVVVVGGTEKAVGRFVASEVLVSTVLP